MPLTRACLNFREETHSVPEIKCSRDGLPRLFFEKKEFHQNFLVKLPCFLSMKIYTAADRSEKVIPFYRVSAFLMHGRRRFHGRLCLQNPQLTLLRQSHFPSLPKYLRA